MAKPNLIDSIRYMTVSQVKGELGLSRFQVNIRIAKGILPAPTQVDGNGVRYFDDRWLKQAKAILV